MKALYSTNYTSYLSLASGKAAWWVESVRIHMSWPAEVNIRFTVALRDWVRPKLCISGTRSTPFFDTSVDRVVFDKRHRAPVPGSISIYFLKIIRLIARATRLYHFSTCRHQQHRCYQHHDSTSNRNPFRNRIAHHPQSKRAHSSLVLSCANQSWENCNKQSDNTLFAVYQ